MRFETRARVQRLRAHPRLAIFAVLVALQAMLVIGVVIREARLLGGTEIVLQSRPVDPRDPIRGDFIILSYVAEDLERVPAFFRPAVGRHVFVEFEQRGRYWVPVFVHPERPPRDEPAGGRAVVRARVTNISPLRVSYPNLGNYFVPQGEGNPPSPPDVIVSVSDDGTARIDHLEIGGERWPDGGERAPR
jgi:uncharacterized membrane-anchored protein